MIIEIGHFAVMLALLVSLLQTMLPMLGASRGNAALMSTAKLTANSSFLLVLVGFIALTIAHMTDDFSVYNVYAYSHTAMPLIYKFAGVWGSHEGSILLWVLMLTGYGAALAHYLRDLPPSLQARAVAVQGLLAFGLLSYVLFASDPFARLFPVPDEGRDLNPLLQDPALAVHPPLLYLGYVGFSTAFSLAAAQLMDGGPWQSWARALRGWVLVAWSALTVGIALGSWWAYYELGWGGWWFWDPVENAALLPWLAGTGLLHSVLAGWQRQAFARWTMLLSILTFALSLIGTFLVRSGLLTSVHSFAADPTRGVFMLSLIALAVGGALALYAARQDRLPASPNFQPLSRETALLYNNLLLTAATLTLLIGTLYPMFLQVLGNDLISVGAPYFNITMVPLLGLLAFGMVLGPLLRWRHSDVGEVLRLLRWVFWAVLSAILIVGYLTGGKNILGLVAVGLGLWVLLGTAQYARQAGRRVAVLLTHGGLGITILGMAGSAFSQQFVMPINLHQTLQLGEYRLQFNDLQKVTGPNYEAERGTFLLWRGDRFIATLQPEQRLYSTQPMVLSNVAIHTNLLQDYYLALSDNSNNEAESTNGDRLIRLQINPLVPWLWLGCGIMAAGGLMAVRHNLKKVA